MRADFVVMAAPAFDDQARNRSAANLSPRLGVEAFSANQTFLAIGHRSCPVGHWASSCRKSGNAISGPDPA